MKKLSYLLMSLTVILSMSSCIKQIEKKYEGGPVVEFDATVLNSATTPYTYHVTARTTPYGIPTTTANSTALTRTSGSVKLRVNLVGPQMSTDQTLTYKVITNVTPPAGSALATEGTHYTTGTTFTIPANSSFGEITVNILNPGTSSTTTREVHLELVGNDAIKPSENYKRVGVRIAQN
jgi:Flp pilus assembly secretin CpaC